MADLRRLLPTTDLILAPPPLDPAGSASESHQGSSATASSSHQPPAAVGADESNSFSNAVAPIDSPIDVSDTPMPDVSPFKLTAHPRRSNRVKSRIISPSSRKASSSSRPFVCHRFSPPASVMPPVDSPVLLALHSPPPVIPAISSGSASLAHLVSAPMHPVPVPPVVVSTSLPMVPIAASSISMGPADTAIHIPVRPVVDVPPPPVFPTSTSAPPPMVPPVPASISSSPATHALRNHLVDILRTLAENQSLFFDYVLAREQHTQVLQTQLYQRIFGISPAAWPSTPEFRPTPKPDSP